MTLTPQEAMASALKAEEDRHAFTVTKWMRERKELVDALAAERADVRRLLEREKALTEQKDGAYSERNKLVAAMSKLFPSWLEDHDAADTVWENDWRKIVFIELPTGQASWHIHDSELPMFAHLSHLCGNSWDGHTNDEKYARLAALSALNPGEKK